MNILIDSNLYKKEYFGDSFDFLLAHGLIELKEYLLSYKVAFVGEVITPSGYFISLPKNFTNTDNSNIELVKSILKEFKNLKKKGKLLIKNKSFEINGEIKSEYYYWRKLYSYFIDYITFEFYYPNKRIIKHSTQREQGRFIPMLTEVNREKIGNGITYEVKDYKENYFRNVFYSALKYLENQFASEIESKKILEIEKFLNTKSIVFKIIKVDSILFLEYSKKLQINPIHEAIKKTLVNYYLNSKIKEKNTINVFYSQEFEYLYEYILQTILGHNLLHKNANWIDPNFKSLRPDIISNKFIGDAKYYRVDKVSENSFEKELYAYNVANNNKQTNFVFIPSEETKHLQTLIHKSYRLELVSLNLKNILMDFKNKKFDTLNYINKLLNDIKTTSANN